MSVITTISQDPSSGTESPKEEVRASLLDKKTSGISHKNSFTEGYVKLDDDL